MKIAKPGISAEEQHIFKSWGTGKHKFQYKSLQNIFIENNVKFKDSKKHLSFMQISENMNPFWSKFVYIKGFTLLIT